jgi:hypothetical protein
VVLLLFAGLVHPASAQTMDAGDHLFEKGQFAEAADIYAAIVAKEPADFAATLQLARIALLSNQLDEAEELFKMVIALKPDATDAKVMLAETYYRKNEFAEAAAALKGVDVANNELIISQYPTLNIAKLESFKGQTPYEISGEGERIAVKFVRTDPLPLVSVKINGGAEVVFFIDTGGSEVTLDTEFAKELGIPDFGSVKGTFSGGENAEVRQGRIETLGIGGWTVKNLPVIMLPLRQLSEGLGVKQIDGIIGTSLFYQFLSTLDFPKGELVLRRKTKGNLEQFLAEDGKRAAIPFWIASDHFMVGWGRIEELAPSLLFVDTGLAGAGVKLAESVIKEAQITLEEDKATTGSGGGGALKIVPYVVKRLSFGDIVEENMPGLFDGPFPWQTMFGFQLAGMIGHDFFKAYAVTFDFETMRIFMQ